MLGRGWTYTSVGGVWIVLVPLVLGIMRWGNGWREDKRRRGLVDDGDSNGSAGLRWVLKEAVRKFED